jgi:iron complex outermembrane receptor protein
LKARRERSLNPADDGLKPTNVPGRSLHAQASYQLLALPELTLSAGVKHEGSRIVLPDNSARIPSWTTLDLAARLVQRMAGTTLTWRLGIDNATDKRAWRESPYQFSHAYLYPLAPRTWRASVQAAF